MHVSFFCVPMFNQEASDIPFDISSVPKDVKSQTLAEKKAPGKKPTGLGTLPSAPTSALDAYEKLLFFSTPEFASFGKLFKVTRLLLFTTNITFNVAFCVSVSIYVFSVVRTCGADRSGNRIFSQYRYSETHL